ncbi:OLC1v1029058C1 [Oldenlandia corymbosa var. corymbosa]|uniref:OLC1v1029058C1 n=1 Tax=Oldenlandia corymbosa var. corymbosa TaxID=529605 RepID=A0AAV1CD61_OLDCO|nr:OLC1v1029058C1 [Oldenlandia corymbosa var. corymbosa]
MSRGLSKTIQRAKPAVLSWRTEDLVLTELTSYGFTFLYLAKNEVASAPLISPDISCLKSLKESLLDPFGHLSNWDFTYSTEGSICLFNGIECWSMVENRVISLSLNNMGLVGQFPAGLKNCRSLQRLDISNNQISGTIPHDICFHLPYLVYLDLSNNQLTGVIPPSIPECSYLNTLSLGANELSGSIPVEMGQLRRLKYFNVSSNRLTGLVPAFYEVTPATVDFGDNPGLGGNPLEGSDHISNRYFFRGLMTGWAASMSLVFLVCWFVVPEIDVKKLYLEYKKKKKRARMNEQSPQQTQGEMNNIMMTAMEKYVPRMPFAELSDATGSFSQDNLIGIGKTGATYKAKIREQFLVAVKCLFNGEHLGRRIKSEILTLARLKHRRLVPLIGFSLWENDVYLVYRYMPNGNLYNWLHSTSQEEGEIKASWPLRFYIALGVAEGLASLHDSSNVTVIHGAVSSKCILLDKHVEPKISNFWEAKFIKLTPRSAYRSDNEELESDKNDVYSFGIVLLELITGKEPRELVSSILDLSPATSPAHFSHAFVLDETLVGQGFEDEIRKCFEVAKNCLRFNPGQRPSMVQVHETLAAIRVSETEVK